VQLHQLKAFSPATKRASHSPEQSFMLFTTVVESPLRPAATAAACPPSAAAEVVVAPAAVHIPQVLASLRKDFSVAAQNCWVKKGGAFTGELRWAGLHEAGGVIAVRCGACCGQARQAREGCL
jgi:hypothetical protein